MFERYTEKARRVIFFARYEASEFGSPEIEAEFLLLGILLEDNHVVARWLDDRDWTVIFREEIAANLPQRAKISTSVDLPLSNEAKRILGYAAEEAEKLRHRHIGVEHLFLGILREKKSCAAKMLFDRGIKIDVVRKTLEKEGIRPVLHGDSRSAVARQLPQVQIVPEENGQPLQLHWPVRIPAVGEILSLNPEQGESVSFQVTKVEWKVTTHPIEPPFLANVLIHVRELRET